MRRPLTTAAVALALVLVGLAACGGDGGHRAAAAEAKVRPELVPPTLADGQLVVRQDDKATAAFGRLPKNALVADGRLYAVRQGERLVATLQVATLLHEVDLTKQKRHDEIVNKLLPGVKQELLVANVPVFEVPGDDKVVYLWFGKQMFQVLQVKGSKVEPEKVLTELIKFQEASPAWEPLPESDSNGGSS